MNMIHKECSSYNEKIEIIIDLLKNVPNLDEENMSSIQLLAYDENVRWASIRDESARHGFSLIAKRDDDKITVMESILENDARKIMDLRSDVQRTSGITTDDVYHTWDNQ